VCSLLTKRQQPLDSHAAKPLQERCCQPLSSCVIHVTCARSMRVSAQQQASAWVPPVLFRFVLSVRQCRDSRRSNESAACRLL